MFHLLRGPIPNRDDFLSREARGLHLRGRDPYREDLNRGVSLVASLDGARLLRTRLPRGHWRYAARLAIPAGVRLEPTFWDGHYTVWADPDDVLRWVVDVVALD